MIKQLSFLYSMLSPLHAFSLFSWFIQRLVLMYVCDPLPHSLVQFVYKDQLSQLSQPSFAEKTNKIAKSWIDKKIIFYTTRYDNRSSISYQSRFRNSKHLQKHAFNLLDYSCMYYNRSEKSILFISACLYICLYLVKKYIPLLIKNWNTEE